MIFVFEVMVTIAAWKRGWRWALLIPLGIAVIVGLFITAAFMLTTGEDEVPFLYMLGVDITYLISAGILSVMTPNRAGKMQPPLLRTPELTPPRRAALFQSADTTKFGASSDKECAYSLSRAILISLADSLTSIKMAHCRL